MASTRMSLSAVLGSVHSAATTVTGALDAASAGIGMLNSFVTQAADNQRIRQIADKEDFVENLISEKAMQRTEMLAKVDKFKSKSQGHAQAYDAAYARFTQLLRDPADLEQLAEQAQATKA